MLACLCDTLKEKKRGSLRGIAFEGFVSFAESPKSSVHVRTDRFVSHTGPVTSFACSRTTHRDWPVTRTPAIRFRAVPFSVPTK